jgi:hypothetical protein
MVIKNEMKNVGEVSGDFKQQFFFVCFFGCAGSGSGQSRSCQIQNIESLKRLYSVCWGGNIGHWGVNYSAEACGHCVKVCLVVLLLKRELDSLPECLRW